MANGLSSLAYLFTLKNGMPLPSLTVVAITSILLKYFWYDPLKKKLISMANKILLWTFLDEISHDIPHQNWVKKNGLWILNT